MVISCNNCSHLKTKREQLISFGIPAGEIDDDDEGILYCDARSIEGDEGFFKGNVSNPMVRIDDCTLLAEK